VLSETAIFIGRRKQTFYCFIIQLLFRWPIEYAVFRFSWRPVHDACSILEELLLLSLLLLLLPFLFSLSSPHDDAVTIVVELMTIFDCVLGLSDSILSSSSKNGGFLLGVAFAVFF